MDRAERVYLVACAAAVAFLASFFLTGLDPVQLPWYLPTEHRWEVTTHPLGLGIDWYGRNLYSGICALIAGAAALVLAKRWRPANPAGLFRMLTLWMVSTFLFAVALFVYQLAPRSPYPAPLPPGYQAR